MFLFWILLILAPFNILYRLTDGGTIWFWLGIFLGFFQVGCFYGPTFATVQELVPPQVKATVVAFYLLMLNLVGVGIGVTLAGYSVDKMIEYGVAMPYTNALLVFTLISFLAIPAFYFAGKRFDRDKQALATHLANKGE